MHADLLRRDMHEILQKTALSREGDGMPCRLHTNHRVRSVDYENGSITFENGKTVKADLIIGSDGIRSAVRPAIGIEYVQSQTSRSRFTDILRVAEPTSVLHR